MANCSVCGKKTGFLEGDTLGRCNACLSKNLQNEVTRATEDQKNQQKAALEQEQRETELLHAQISAVLLTTETASDKKIIERLEIVSAEVAYGMNMSKDLFAGVRDIVGGRSKTVQKTMREARRTALVELKREAF